MDGSDKHNMRGVHEAKSKLTSLLADFSHLLCSQPFSPLLCETLLSYASSLSSLSTPHVTTVSHVVRDQTYKLLFDWIKMQYHITTNDVIIIRFDNEEEGEEEGENKLHDIIYNDSDSDVSVEDLSLDPHSTERVGNARSLPSAKAAAGSEDKLCL